MRQSQLRAEASHFVLEQFAQRLDQFQAHMRRQAAHVVVGLDDMRLAGLGAGGLDDIRVDGALRQEADILELVRFLFEHLDEQAADDLALGLRVGDALERRQEALRGIHADDFHAQVLREGAHDLIALPQAHQAMIHEHAHQPIADRQVQQRGHDARIDAPGQPQQHLAVADLRTHALRRHPR